MKKIALTLITLMAFSAVAFADDHGAKPHAAPAEEHATETTKTTTETTKKKKNKKKKAEKHAEHTDAAPAADAHAAPKH